MEATEHARRRRATLLLARSPRRAGLCPRALRGRGKIWGKAGDAAGDGPLRGTPSATATPDTRVRHSRCIRLAVPLSHTSLLSPGCSRDNRGPGVMLASLVTQHAARGLCWALRPSGSTLSSSTASHMSGDPGGPRSSKASLDLCLLGVT